MHYPWWHVPYLTAPMLIAVISVLHVLVSHYAVGGGLFLAVEVRHAYRTRDRNYLDYLHGHARFFILLTVVFGAISGVGIWWTIGLASPLATEVLIHTFVFGWATEWVFFVIEIISAFIFFYYWGRLAEKTHVVIGWIYALAAWISLVLITGITAFMLNPGLWAATDPVGRDFWTAFFNPQFLPQTIARTGGALLLSSLYVYLHASLTIREARLRDMIASRSARPALIGAVLITVGGMGWHYFLPPSAEAALVSAAALNVLMALIFALTIAVFFLLYVGPYRNPGWLSPGFAGSLCLFGIAAFSTGEFIREAVRKPFVVYNVVLANQIFPEQVPTLRANGYLEGGTWTKAIRQGALSANDRRRSNRRQRDLGNLPPGRSHRAGPGPFPVPLQRLPRGDRGLFGPGSAAARAVARDDPLDDRAPRQRLVYAALVRHAGGGRIDDRLPVEHHAAAAGRNDRGR